MSPLPPPPFPTPLVTDRGQRSPTNEHEIDGDADCARQSETVCTEQHQVADDAEVANTFQ